MSRLFARGLFTLIALSLACEAEPRDFLGGPGGIPGGGGTRLGLRIGGLGPDAVSGVAGDAAGAVYVTGTFSGSVDFDPSASAERVLSSLGGTDVFVAKYSATHALIWVAQLGGTGEEATRAITLDPAGNVVVAGWFEGTPDFDPGPGLAVLPSSGGKDGFVAQLSPTGTFLWARRFGGLSDDQFTAIIADANGVFAAGEFEGTADGAPGGPAPIAPPGSGLDAVVVAFESGGAPLVVIPFGGPGEDRATAVALDAGFVYVGGRFNSSVDFDPSASLAAATSLGGTDGFVAKFSTPGVFQWVRQFGGTTEDAVSEGGLTIGNGLIQAIGTFTGTIDLDPLLGVVAVQSQGLEDMFLVQLTVDGELSSSMTLGGTGSDAALRLSTSGGDIVVAGTFAAAVDFDPGPGVSALTPVGAAGTIDAFVARYGPTGQLIWARQFGSGQGQQTSPLGLVLLASGQTVFGGRFFGDLDADPSFTVFALSSQGDAEGFVIRLSSAGGLASAP